MAGREARLRGGWQGRVSGCMLGKAVEAYSMTQGHEKLTAYLDAVGALPLRDYIPLADEPPPLLLASCSRGQFASSEPDDDIDYSVLALDDLAARTAAVTERLSGAH